MTPVVFVHGFMGGSRQWQGQAELAKEPGIIGLDLPGFGENADQEALTSIARYAEWALTELGARGVDRFNLVGHSMGGMVAQEMVAQAPERTERLVLYGTGATGVLPGRFETIDTSKRRAREDGPKATARRIAATWFLEKEDAEGYEGCAAIAERCGLPAMLNGLETMQNWSGTERLGTIESETLVIWGDRDRTYPWCQTEQLWQTIPHTNLMVMPECAHAAHLEKPWLFNAVLRDFLNR